MRADREEQEIQNLLKESYFEEKYVLTEGSDRICCFDLSNMFREFRGQKPDRSRDAAAGRHYPDRFHAAIRQIGATGGNIFAPEAYRSAGKEKPGLQSLSFNRKRPPGI